jgi:ribosomal protein L37AE/L43A
MICKQKTVINDMQASKDNYVPTICKTRNSRRTKTKVWTLCPFLELGTKHPWKELQR